MNRPTSPMTIRLDPAQIDALDRLAKRQNISRAQLLREAVELRLSIEAQSRILSDAVRVAADDATVRVRQEAQKLMTDMLDLARVTDETHRQLLADFLDALASADGGTAQQKPHANSSGKVAMPPRPER